MLTRETFKTVITAVITLFVLGGMAVGVLGSREVGMFEPLGTLVMGYWFGAGAQEAVSKARHQSEQLPSVL